MILLHPPMSYLYVQCDHKSGLFLHYLAIYNNENLPNSMKNAEVGS